jgi:hypothetical protein
MKIIIENIVQQKIISTYKVQNSACICSEKIINFVLKILIINKMETIVQNEMFSSLKNSRWRHNYVKYQAEETCNITNQKIFFIWFSIYLNLLM